MSKSNRFEGVKELVGLIVVLGTGATLSMAWDAFGGSRAPLRVVARESGDVWIGHFVDNVFAGKEGSLAAGAFGDFKAKVGVNEVTLREGERVIAKSYVVVEKGKHAEVVVGTIRLPGTPARELFEGGGALWLLGDQGPRATFAEAQKACPAGFVLPSAQQWKQLAEQFGGCSGCDVTVDAGSAGIALISDRDVGFDLAGNSHYWSNTPAEHGEVSVVATSFAAGGTGMRDKNEYERRDAKLYEKARGTPQTLNEQRKSRDRVNAKVEYSYGPSASLSMTSLSPEYRAEVRCVKQRS